MSGRQRGHPPGHAVRCMARSTQSHRKKAAIEFTRLGGAGRGDRWQSRCASRETLGEGGLHRERSASEERKPQTRVRMSPAGRRAFAERVAYLREIIDSAGADRHWRLRRARGGAAVR